MGVEFFELPGEHQGWAGLCLVQTTKTSRDFRENANYINKKSEREKIRTREKR